MAKIRWRGRFTEPPRFIVGSEHVRDEPVLYYLMGMTPVDDKIRREHDIETAFYGRGGIAKVKAAAQKIVDYQEEDE